MISDYDIVDTKFLGVFPLNLYRLDHGIGPCNVSIGSIRRLHSSDSLGSRGSQVGARSEGTADASIGIIADILYMKMKQETNSKTKMWLASSKFMLR
jgi:hypothetical protein